jgi:hypothetical protein
MELADDRERLFAMGAAAVKKAELLSWAARAGTFLEILGKRLSISIPETRVLRRGSPALNAW